MNIQKFPFIVLSLGLSLVLCSCNKRESAWNDNTVITTVRESKTMTYKQITQDEAKKIIDDTSVDFIILDVRTLEEYTEKHIPNAVCIPNETITDTEPAELPDKDQLILVYCRSGRRSKESAQKLADMGYTNILEFGGITEWKYETVSETE